MRIALDRLSARSDDLHPVERSQTRETHDIAVLRMIQAGAVPNTTMAMITEWFRDWAGPLAPAAREVIVPFLKEIAIQEDIYPRAEAARAADARAAEARVAEQTPAGARR